MHPSGMYIIISYFLRRSTLSIVPPCSSSSLCVLLYFFLLFPRCRGLPFGFYHEVVNLELCLWSFSLNHNLDPDTQMNRSVSLHILFRPNPSWPLIIYRLFYGINFFLDSHHLFSQELLECLSHSSYFLTSVLILFNSAFF